ncbi:PREDICTED: involucrin [Elephantulus edwardii]|uniref:involucrin n=1 Tax=Elephantulus edwardii TaxID=28737 RepID=UPI0003F0B24F|nr:PREDICTED: involucrin [Elephantulus edwardii]
MSQQFTLPVTIPPALSQQPLKTVCLPTNIQHEQVKQPTLLPAPCQEMPFGFPVAVPSEEGTINTAPMKGMSEQEGQQQPQESQEQEQQQQEPQQHEQQQEHQETGNTEQQLEYNKTQSEQQLKEQLEQEKLLDQQLDQKLAKEDDEQQLEKKGQLLEHLEHGSQSEPSVQQEEQPVLDPVHVAQLPKGDVFFPTEQEQPQQQE